MWTLLQDLRFALRQFRKSPGFVITAILSLMLGIGATTAIFSVVYGVLLDPYPYKDNDRMVHVQLNEKNSERGGLLRVNGTGYKELRRISSLDDVFLQQESQENLTGDQIPISVNVGSYSPNLFEYMGVPPLLGRQFSPADAPGGNAAPVAVLSYLFWQRQFGGSRDVVGKSIELDHKLYTVIGVARTRFTWGDSDVYIPAVPTADPHEYWLAFVKLKPGTKFPVAQAEFQALADEFAKQDKDFPQNRKVKIVSLNEQVLGKFAGTLALLFGAVLALLVIGCANVSILLLARGTARQHELAVRVSVGAGRQRLIRQLLTESVVLSVTGAALGVLVAYKGVDALATFLPYYSFPHEAAIHVNAMVLAFSAAVGLLTGILFGVSPAWQLSRPHLGNLIQASNAKHTGSAHNRNTHRLLIAGQVALTLVLLAAAGAAMKTFAARIHTPLGFEPDHVIALNVGFPKGSNPTWEGRLNANEAVRKAITEVPGVDTASVSTTWFPGFGGFTAKIEVQGKPSLTDAEAMLCLVSPREFLTLRIPLRAGRVYDDSENMRAAHLAVVNQAFVKQFVGDGDPIGLSVRSPRLKLDQPSLLLASSPDDWLQIIGVVGDARNDGLDHPIKPAVFLPYSFVLPPDESLLVRATGDPDTTLRAIKERLRLLNPEMVVGNTHTLQWWLETQGWGQERFIATLFSLFAVLALALAATGLYSVVSFAVNQRTQEVGIRMALGARRTSILRLVLASTGTMLGFGLALGLGLSVALNGVVVSWVNGSSRDPLTLLTSAMLLLLVAVTACVVPAWRAATIDPMRALRTE
ncbi:MAG TPA: ABC transporter permease [Candidatus Acidoferrum sp.]|nr:ABC transporter permease [Candidatus Acidoferrum sp.]